MSSRRCRPPLRHASLPIEGPLDALEVVTSLRSVPERHETICLLLDVAHRGGPVVVVEGCVTSDHLGTLAESLGPALSGTDRCALVLATVRPHGGPASDDHFAFAPLRDVWSTHGITLLDWFVLAGRVSWSLAELTDACWWWREPR